MLGTYAPLLLFMVAVAAGLGIASPAGAGAFAEMGRTRRRLLGLLIVQAGGLATSLYTWMIHNQIAETGGSGLCGATGMVQCGSVIGDPTYSTFFGLPWGVIGILAFAALGWLTLSIFLDMQADWSKKYLDYTWYLALPAVPGIAWLVIVELFLVDGAPQICPYCTGVHIALLITLYLLHSLRGERDEGMWEVTVQKSKEELLAIARGKKA